MTFIHLKSGSFLRKEYGGGSKEVRAGNAVTSTHVEAGRSMGDQRAWVLDGLCLVQNHPMPCDLKQGPTATLLTPPRPARVRPHSLDLGKHSRVTVPPAQEGLPSHLNLD